MKNIQKAVIAKPLPGLKLGQKSDEQEALGEQYDNANTH